MTITRPYLLRAFYQWIMDNQLTPHLMVDATMEGVQVPEEHIQNGQIVLNISANAVRELKLENHAVSFDARFSGVTRHIYLPILAIEAIYAIENGRGMQFSSDEEGDVEGSGDASGSDKSGKPSLKIVK